MFCALCQDVRKSVHQWLIPHTAMTHRTACARVLVFKTNPHTTRTEEVFPALKITINNLKPLCMSSNHSSLLYKVWMLTTETSSVSEAEPKATKGRSSALFTHVYNWRSGSITPGWCAWGRLWKSLLLVSLGPLDHVLPLLRHLHRSVHIQTMGCRHQRKGTTRLCLKQCLQQNTRCQRLLRLSCWVQDKPLTLNMEEDESRSLPACPRIASTPRASEVVHEALVPTPIKTDSIWWRPCATSISQNLQRFLAEPDRYQFVAATAGSSSAHIPEAVKINCPGGIGGQDSLHEGEQPFQALQVLPGGLIVHDVGGVHCVSNLLSRASVVDADAGHTNRPRSISYMCWKR